MATKLYNGKKWPDMECINCGGYIHRQTQQTGHFDHASTMPIRVLYTAFCGDCKQAYAVFFVDGKVKAKYTIDDIFNSIEDRRQWPRFIYTRKNGSFL